MPHASVVVFLTENNQVLCVLTCLTAGATVTLCLHIPNPKVLSLVRLVLLVRCRFAGGFNVGLEKRQVGLRQTFCRQFDSLKGLITHQPPMCVASLDIEDMRTAGRRPPRPLRAKTT